ncbi:MAG: hypothetical protein H0U49_02395 [Parachlamydiaceae bacterium]|nr:hypothetical protein [Parachlamydiaceae bacterium]
MNVSNNVLVPCHSSLNQWFHDALTYDALKKRVLAGELKSLSTQDSAFVLAFVAKQGWICLAVQNDDKPFVQALAEAGADLSAVDDEGNSILVNAKTADMFRWLHEKGAKFIHANNVSMLQFVFDHSQRLFSIETEWKNLLVEIMPSATLEDFCALDKKQLINLMGMAKDNEVI